MSFASRINDLATRIATEIKGMKPISYAPATMVVNTGTLTQGTVADLAAVSGTDVLVTEASGTDPLRVTLGFTGVTRMSSFVFYGRYNGGSSHIVNIEIYNTISTAWDLLGTIGYAATKGWYSVNIFNTSAYLSGGAVQIRFSHAGSGVVTHQLVLDYASVTYGSGGGGSSTVAASSVIFTPVGNVAATNVQSAISELDTEKQEALVSGTNIKTINSQSLLGAGNIVISGGGGASAPITVTPDASNISNIDLSLGTYFKLNLADSALNDISIVGTPVKTSFGAATSGTLNLPTGLQQGDVVICTIGSDGSTPSLPSGWTNISNAFQTSEFHRTFYKVMGAVPDTSVSFISVSTATAGISIAFRNVHADVFDVPVVTSGAATGMPDAPSVTTQSNGCMILIIGLIDDDNVQASVTVPSGYSNLQAIQSSTAGQTVMLATKLQTTAGYEQPAAFGGTGTDDWVSLTIVLKRKVNVPVVTMSNIPTGVVSDIKLRITSSSSLATFPASFSWGWKPNFAVFTDTIVNLSTDDNGTTWKVDPFIPLNKFIDSNVISAVNVDWAAGSIFTKTLTGTTTLTFTNLQLNKTITLIISGVYSLSWPSYCKKISGDFDTAALNYIQLHCTNATKGSEQVWRIISKETT